MRREKVLECFQGSAHAPGLDTRVVNGLLGGSIRQGGDFAEQRVSPLLQNRPTELLVQLTRIWEHRAINNSQILKTLVTSAGAGIKRFLALGLKIRCRASVVIE
jgi:hypothetical protein